MFYFPQGCSDFRFVPVNLGCRRRRRHFFFLGCKIPITFTVVVLVLLDFLIPISFGRNLFFFFFIFFGEV